MAIILRRCNPTQFSLSFSQSDLLYENPGEYASSNFSLSLSRETVSIKKLNRDKNRQNISSRQSCKIIKPRRTWLYPISVLLRIGAQRKVLLWNNKIYERITMCTYIHVYRALARGGLWFTVQVLSYHIGVEGKATEKQGERERATWVAAILSGNTVPCILH